MILPGNSRQIITEALNGLTEAPLTATSKAVHDLDDAGFRIVHHGELAAIIDGLLSIIDTFDQGGNMQTDDRIVRAKALLEILTP